MTDKTFEEEFPSYELIKPYNFTDEQGHELKNCVDFTENFIDKQRVRDLLTSDKAIQRADEEPENNGFLSALDWVREELGL